jgi:hypothetical protein
MSPGRNLTSMTVPALLGFEASIVGELRQRGLVSCAGSSLERSPE